MAMATDSKADPQNETDDPTATIESLRTAYWQKRQMLLKRAAQRRNRQRALHLISGIVTLASGGLVTILLASTVKDEAQTAKFLGAITAFLSGVLSLVATTYFDVKDTQKISDGASEYGMLIDLLDNLKGKFAELQRKTVGENLNKIREKARVVSTQIEPYLPTGERYFSEARTLEVFLKNNPGAAASLTDLFH
jgi:hypothetical protein